MTKPSPPTIGNTSIPSQPDCVWRIGLYDLSKYLQRNRLTDTQLYTTACVGVYQGFILIPNADLQALHTQLSPLSLPEYHHDGGHLTILFVTADQAMDPESYPWPASRY